MIKLSPKLSITALPAFTDNYLWLIDDGKSAAIVDPGDAQVVKQALAKRELQLRDILVTHHHPDHIGGVSELKAWTGATVHAPATEAAKIPAIDEALSDGDVVLLPQMQLKLRVMSVPGHTLGHIAYHCAERAWLFCGDTLFRGGCGRLFEGTPEQMHASLQRLAGLPDETQCFCAHEYTQTNLRFAHAVEPDNKSVATLLDSITAMRARGEKTVPVRLGEDRKTNPFLRCHDPDLARAVLADEVTVPSSVKVFSALRRQKDVFTG